MVPQTGAAPALCPDWESGKHAVVPLRLKIWSLMILAGVNNDMQTCINCSNIIPTFILHDGKKKRLYGRKFCLTCSPFGTWARKRSLSFPQPNKTCPHCKLSFPRTSEFFSLRKNGGFTYCKSCQTAFVMKRQRSIKQMCVEYKGGKCVCCGYSNYLGALEFHHVQPDKKDFTIGRYKNTKLAVLMPELDKCILVCAVCHKEIHGGVRTPPQWTSNFTSKNSAGFRSLFYNHTDFWWFVNCF